MKIKIGFILLSLLLLSTLLAVACGESEPTTAPATQPATAPATAPATKPATVPATQPATAPATQPAATAPATETTPKYGGVLKIATRSSPVSLGNTATMTGRDYYFVMPVFEFFINSDAQGQPLPGLATEWEIDPNGKYFIFTLREGVKFHDGTDWNAESAKVNLEAIIKGPIVELPGVTSVEVVDTYKVKLNTDFYSSVVMDNLTVPISSAKNLARGDDAIRFDPVGSGPFKFVEFQRDNFLKFERFDGYWEEGKPYLDGIEYRFIADPMTASAAFQADEVQQYDRPSITIAKDLVAKGNRLTSVLATENGLAPDTANPDSAFADIRVREAIEYAIDRDAIAETLGQGFMLSRNQFAAPGNIGYHEDLGREYNPEKARQLLTEAGYPKGFKTTIIAPPPPSGNKDVVTAVQSYLAAVGIQAELDQADTARWTELRYATGWTNGLVWMQSGKFPSIPRSLTMTFSEARHDYVSMVRPPKINDLLIEIQAASDPNVQVKLIEEMTQLIYDEAVFVPLYFPYNICISKPYLHDDERYGERQSLSQWDPQNAWMSK